MECGIRLSCEIRRQLEIFARTPFCLPSSPRYAPQGPAIFRHHDHLERLFKSAELYYMPIPYTLEELRAATHELIAANELRECYIRPIVFRGYGQMGLYPLDAPVEVSIAA